MKRATILIILVLTLILSFYSVGLAKTLKEDLAPNNIQQLLIEEKYDALESIATKCRNNNVELTQGKWALQKFYASLVPLRSSSSEKEYSELISRLNAWKSKMPDAATPRVALMSTYTSYAWKARGTGWANSVTEDAWKLFRERIVNALDELKSPVVFTDPHAYYAIMVLMRAVGGSDAKAKSYFWFKKGLEIDDYYFPLYEEMAYTLTERWYGRPGEWLEFAKIYSDMLGGIRGKTIYVRLIWAQQFRYYSFDFFSRYNISWPELKATLKEIAEHKPDSDMDLNIYCYLASIALDYKTATALFFRISREKRYVGLAWQADAYFANYYTYYKNIINSRRRYDVITIDLTSMWSPGQDLAETRIVLIKPGGKEISLNTLNQPENLSNGSIITSYDAKKHKRVIQLPVDSTNGKHTIVIAYKNKQTRKEFTKSFEIER